MSSLQVVPDPIQSRPRSPVTVDEWVAALPEPDDQTDLNNQKNSDNENEDVFTWDEMPHHQVLQTEILGLGAEAGYLHTQNAAKLIWEKRQRLCSGSERRRLLQHSDTTTSLQSENSNFSVSSVDSLLQSRNADPEEVLLNLGFGIGSMDIARIPSRFFTRSRAKGVDIGNFLKKQAEMVEKFESGFSGYRGLSGSTTRRPSEIVEKIIETIREKEKCLQRTESNDSWMPLGSKSHIPTRFRPMNPNRPTFSSVVEKVTEAASRGDGPRSFRSIARSVLSPQNREWRMEATNKEEEDGGGRRIVMGGKHFVVDEDGNEIEVNQYVNKTDPPNTMELNNLHSEPEQRDHTHSFKTIS